MTSKQQHVIDYFDQTHNDYRLLWGIDRHLGLHCGFSDEQVRGHDQAVLHMNQVLASMAGISASDRVVDAGCGIGGSALWIAEHIGAAVVGVNINPRQIEQARQLAKERRLDKRVQFHVADFCATRLAGESFNIAWALESACYAEDKRLLLRELWRLLKPGGRLVVADGFLARPTRSKDEGRLVERWRRGWAIPSVACASEFRGWLRDAGFRQIRFEDITRHVVPSSRRIYLATVLCYPLGWLLHALGRRTELQMRGIASGYYQYHARRRGLGIYGVFQAVK